MPKTKMIAEIQQQADKVLSVVLALASFANSFDTIDDDHRPRFKAADAELHKLGELMAKLEKHIASWDSSPGLKGKVIPKLTEARTKAKNFLAGMKNIYRLLNQDMVEVAQMISSRQWAPARPAGPLQSGPAPARPAQGPVGAGKH